MWRNHEGSVSARREQNGRRKPFCLMPSNWAWARLVSKSPDYNDKSIVATRVSRSPPKEVELMLDDFPIRKHEKNAKKFTAKAVQKPKSVKVGIRSEPSTAQAQTSQATVTKKKATSQIKHVYSLRTCRPTQQ
ncbi:hypothetical protein B0H14DRAFT_2621880 [Mycena olivaceomarginata]|nr:hypothetical protein B0H14DRAFT_2621880 [Mycena olivaceomarginata]